MKNTLSVRCPAFGHIIGTLSPRGESFAFKPSASSVRNGTVPGSGHVSDFKGAAIYLVREPAAISANVGGYVVGKDWL